jgi:hypothetical protein
MKHYRTFVVAILAGIAFSASARNADITVGMDQACPAGTTSKGASYQWDHGRLVRKGSVCEDRQTRN